VFTKGLGQGIMGSGFVSTGSVGEDEKVLEMDVGWLHSNVKMYSMLAD
jgi:hypothetical protein